jgi:hypothetical protein
MGPWYDERDEVDQVVKNCFEAGIDAPGRDVVLPDLKKEPPGPDGRRPKYGRSYFPCPEADCLCLSLVTVIRSKA